MDKIAVSVTVRAENQIIEEFIQYHLEKNISEIFIFLDDPIFNKKIPDIYQDHPVVKFIQCDDKYWLSNTINLNGNVINSKPKFIEDRQLANYLHAYEMTNCDWLANIDIDELIYSPYHLDEILTLLPDNIFSIRMRPAEAVYEKKVNGIFDTSYFKIINIKNSRLSKKIYSNELRSNGGYWGHKLGKILARTNQVIQFIGNHKIIPVNDILIRDIELNFLNLLHFEGMNEQLFIEKQCRRFNQNVNLRNLANNELKRLEYFKKSYKEGGEIRLKKLYEHMHIFDNDRLDFGINSGFIKKIDYRIPPKTYNIGLKDYHYKNLYYSLEEKKLVSSTESLDFKLYVLFFSEKENQNKAIFFIKNKQGKFKPLITNGINFYPSKSMLFNTIEVLKKEDFYVFIREDCYLISLPNGRVHHKSKNLGEWELFEKSIED